MFSVSLHFYLKLISSPNPFSFLSLSLSLFLRRRNSRLSRLCCCVVHRSLQASEGKMQRDTCFADGLEAISSPLRSKYQRQSSSLQVTPSKINGSSSEEMNNSMSPSKSASFPCSVFLTPSPCSSSYSEEMNNSIATENRLYLARLTLEYQELVDRYGLCLSHLQEAAKEAEILRQENATLRMLNKDLMKRLSLLAENSLNQFQNRYLSSSTAAAAAASYPALSIINDFRSLSIGGANNRRNSLVSDVPVTSPTSVIATNNNNQVDPKRVSLPKSISIRSSGYLKMNQAAVNKAAASSRTIRVRLGTQPVLNPVHVAGNDKEGDDEKSPLELDVYNQGMFKTELCNKWQETGACPYGEHCQFAHGINELRPIIRHPRYKTEVCRMVLSGDMCPYGHRCHFRHALTDEEKLIAAAAAHGGAYH